MLKYNRKEILFTKLRHLQDMNIHAVQLECLYKFLRSNCHDATKTSERGAKKT